MTDRLGGKRARRVLWSSLAGCVNYGAVIICSLQSFRLVCDYLGGPIHSPDSMGYLRAAAQSWHVSTLWAQIAEWQPTGLPLLLSLAFTAGLDERTALQVLWTALCLAFYFILVRGGGWAWAWIGLLVFLFDPSWIVLRLSLWTEMPFMLTVLLTLATLSLKRLHWPIKVLATALWFFCSLRFRHSGVFLLPGLVAGLGFTWGSQRWNFSPLRAGAAGLAILTVWLVSNYASTGDPLTATQARSRLCKTIVVSLNELPYCQWNPDIPICALDPERKFLNTSSLALKERELIYHDPGWNYVENGISQCDQLAHLHFGQTSPIWIYENTPIPVHDAEKWCLLRDEIIRQAVTHAPGRFAGMMALRMWQQFGAWEWTERWTPVGPVDASRVAELDWALDRWNRAQWVFQGFLVLSSIGFLVLRRGSPVVAYSWLGALGHAAGIALINPFLALRYMAIAKLLIAICAFYVLLERRRARVGRARW
jgi:hypothetical protein